MSAEPAEAETHRFRVFTRGKKRRAFRLEPVFWDALEAAAKARGLRLRDFIFELAGDHGESTNLSSRLRVAAANWMRTEAERQHSRLVSQAALGVLNAAPAAGLVIDEHKRIISHNRAMLDFIQQRRSHGDTRISEAHLIFDLPIEQIFDIIAQSAGKLVECGFRLTINGEPIGGRMRIGLFPTPPGTLRQLLAFVI